MPFGWIIGCPLLGFLSDRIGRRKPVIVAGRRRALRLPGLDPVRPVGVLPPYVLGLVAGIASGAAMLPYTVIKEANPPHMSGTATGVVNFLNFTFSALLTPVFGWLLLRVSGGVPQLQLEHYQTTFAPLLYRRGARHRPDLLPEGNRTGECSFARPTHEGNDESTTGTGKYEALLARCRSLDPVPTAVAHPVRRDGARRRDRGRREGADHADPRRTGRARSARSPKRHGIDLGRHPHRRRAAQPRVGRRRRSNSSAAAKPSS